MDSPPSRWVPPAGSLARHTPASESAAGRLPAAAGSRGCCGQHRPSQQLRRGAFDAPARRDHADAKKCGQSTASFLRQAQKRRGRIRPAGAPRRHAARDAAPTASDDHSDDQHWSFMAGASCQLDMGGRLGQPPASRHYWPACAPRLTAPPREAAATSADLPRPSPAVCLTRHPAFKLY